MCATPKKRLCWNCDGSIPIALEYCTYCGVNLSKVAQSTPKKPATESLDLTTGLKSDLLPNFSKRTSVGTQSETQDFLIPKSPFNIVSSPALSPSNKAVSSLPPTAVVGSHETDDFRTTLWPIVCLTGGSLFFLFGLVLALLSTDGHFSLQWNSTHWYLYLVGGASLLFAGWRLLKRIDVPDDATKTTPKTEP